MTTIGFSAARPIKSNALLAEALSSLRVARLVATTRRDHLDISSEITHLAGEVAGSEIDKWRAPATTALAGVSIALALVTTGLLRAAVIGAAIVVTLVAAGAIHRHVEFSAIRFHAGHLIDEVVADALLSVDLSDDDRVRTEVERGLRALAIAPTMAASLEAAARVEYAAAW